MSQRSSADPGWWRLGWRIQGGALLPEPAQRKKFGVLEVLEAIFYRRLMPAAVTRPPSKSAISRAWTHSPLERAVPMVPTMAMPHTNSSGKRQFHIWLSPGLSSSSRFARKKNAKIAENEVRTRIFVSGRMARARGAHSALMAAKRPL